MPESDVIDFLRAQFARINQRLDVITNNQNEHGHRLSRIELAIASLRRDCQSPPGLGHRRRGRRQPKQPPGQPRRTNRPHRAPPRSRRRPRRMTAAEIRAIFAALNLTQGGAATLLGVAPRTIAGWCSGNTPVSTPAARLLRLLHANPDLMHQVA